MPALRADVMHSAVGADYRRGAFDRIFVNSYDCRCAPPWWNWYTQQVEGLCPSGHLRSSRSGGTRDEMCEKTTHTSRFSLCGPGRVWEGGHSRIVGDIT